MAEYDYVKLIFLKIGRKIPRRIGKGYLKLPQI
jgi:hypothetical protein